MNNEYYEIKFQLMNEQNYELLHEIWKYFKQYINAPICDATNCKYIIYKYKGCHQKFNLQLEN